MREVSSTERIKNIAQDLLVDKKLSEDEEAVISRSDVVDFINDCEYIDEDQWDDLPGSTSKSFCRYDEGSGHEGDGYEPDDIFWRVSENRFRLITDKPLPDPWKKFTKAAPNNFLFRALVERPPDDPCDLREIKKEDYPHDKFYNFWEDYVVDCIEKELSSDIEVNVYDKSESKKFRNEIFTDEVKSIRKKRKKCPDKYYSLIAKRFLKRKPDTFGIFKQFNGIRETPDILLVYDGEYLPIECKSVKGGNKVKMGNSIMHQPYLYVCVKHLKNGKNGFSGYRNIFGEFANDLDNDEVSKIKEETKKIKEKVKPQMEELDKKLYGKENFDMFSGAYFRPQHAEFDLSCNRAEKLHEKTNELLKETPPLFEPGFNE